MNSTMFHVGNLLEVSGSYWKTCVLHVAVKIDIFTHLGDEAMDGAVIAQVVDAKKDGILRLLDALSAMGLMLKNGTKYSNSDISKVYLCKDSENYIGYIILHHYNLMKRWTNLDRAIMSDQFVSKLEDSDVEENHEAFIMGMHNISMNCAPEIIPLIKLNGRKHILDLGGGPGTYTIHFCKHNPGLKATLFDLPETIPFAKKTIKKFNLIERVSFLSGNFIYDSIGDKYDVIWMSHILHSLSLQNCKKLLNKALSSLESNGMLLIHDFILNNKMDGPLFPALFSLNMFISTSDGRSYSENQLKQMLVEVGFKNIKRVEFEGPNGSGLLSGCK